MVSLVHWFIDYSFAHSFTDSLWFVVSLIHLFVDLLIRSFMNSLVHRFNVSLIHYFIDSSVQ